jgi:group I intron endonuclease
MVGIYKITNPKGRIYIGQSVNIEIRKSKYRCLSHSSKQPKIFASIQKYGWEQHKFEEIEECPIEQLNEREVYWKQYYLDQVGGEWKKVMFCNLYDNGGGPLSEETKQKISKANKGKIPNEKTKQRRIMGMKRGKHCKPAYQYDLEGNFIQKWNFREDAEQTYNLGKKSNNITSCIIGKAKTAYGFQWKSSYSNKIPPIEVVGKSVGQFDLNGNLIKQWKSCREAEQHFNPESFQNNKYGANNLHSNISGRQKTAYGFIWKYLDV